MCVGCELCLSWVCLRCVLDVSATTNTNTPSDLNDHQPHPSGARGGGEDGGGGEDSGGGEAGVRREKSHRRHRVLVQTRLLLRRCRCACRVFQSCVTRFSSVSVLRGRSHQFCEPNSANRKSCALRLHLACLRRAFLQMQEEEDRAAGVPRTATVPGAPLLHLAPTMPSRIPVSSPPLPG